MGIEDKYKQKIITIILALLPNTKIYLFGSRARENHSHGSDVDIALDTGKKIYFSDVGEIRDVIEATHIPYKVDVVDYNAISKDMCEMIDKEKIVWKS